MSGIGLSILSDLLDLGVDRSAISCGEPLCNHSTWGIGGPTDSLVEPKSWQQVGSILRYAHDNDLPTIVIGKGSNLLFDDAGFRGIVIKIGRKLSRLSISGTTIRAESGLSVSRLARAAGQAGLSGLEHIVGIPGTLGGLVVMNGGSQRKAIGDVIVEVRTMNRQGVTCVFKHEDCGFAYRHSRFHDENLVVNRVVMDLAVGRPNDSMREMLDILRLRRKKFPLTMPNCGSVFKSSPELHAAAGSPGKLLEDLGLKGRSVGGAAVSDRHANFIINRGSAKASDVLALARFMRDVVKRRTGLTLESEVQFVGPSGYVQPI